MFFFVLLNITSKEGNKNRSENIAIINEIAAIIPKYAFGLKLEIVLVPNPNDKIYEVKIIDLATLRKTFLDFNS